MKKRNSILWFDMGHKEVSGFNAHWMKEGRLDGERRFTLSCPKEEPIRIILHDLKTEVKHEVNPGCINGGFRLANSILGREKTKWSGTKCEICNRERRFEWSVKEGVWINIMGKKNNRSICLECFIQEADKKSINIKFSAITYFKIVGQNIKGDVLIK